MLAALALDKLYLDPPGTSIPLERGSEALMGDGPSCRGLGGILSCGRTDFNGSCDQKVL